LKKINKNFSVIISVYDGIEIKLLKKSLKSLLLQNYLPKEIIIILDGIKKKILINEINIFKKIFKRVRLIKNKKNLGISKSYNKAIKIIKTDIIAIQDSDDISLPDRFKLQYEYLKKNENISVVGSSVFEKDLDSGKKTIKKSPQTHERIKQYIKFRNPMNHPTIMFRKSAIQKVGGYLNLSRMEDYYLWIRLISSGFFINNIARPLVVMNVKKDFYIRRSGFELLKSEIVIQNILFKNGFNNLFYLIFIFFFKSTYHLSPRFIKKFFRYLLFSKFIK
jgi:GT2 family glycosyltransferase